LNLLLPIGAACPTAASCLAFEKLLDLISAQRVEVVRYLYLPRHETKALGSRRFANFTRDHLHHWFSSLGNEERLTFGGLLDQPGQMRFCEVDVVGAHAATLAHLIGTPAYIRVVT
jgi:hypothetical protein